jgi:hypothetical protein
MFVPNMAVVVSSGGVPVVENLVGSSRSREPLGCCAVERDSGLPWVRVRKADRGALRFIPFRTTRREALQQEGGSALGRRERPAIDDQAHALESSRDPIQRFSFGGEFGVHCVLPKVMVTLVVSLFSR